MQTLIHLLTIMPGPLQYLVNWLELLFLSSKVKITTKAIPLRELSLKPDRYQF